MVATDIHHVVPDVHFLAQETPKDAVSEEHGLQVEVRADHHIGHSDVLGYDGYLVFVKFHLFAIHLSLYLAVGADDDGVHGHMSSIDLGKLLNTINDHNIVVGIANLDILIVS